MNEIEKASVFFRNQCPECDGKLNRVSFRIASKRGNTIHKLECKLCIKFFESTWAKKDGDIVYDVRELKHE